MGNLDLSTRSLAQVTANPGSPADGDQWYRSDLSQLWIDAGAKLVPIAPLADWPIIKAGYAYFTPPAGANTSLAATQSRLHYIPFIVPRKTTLTSYWVEITTAVASTTARSAVYDSDSAGELPGAMIGVELTTQSTATTGAKAFTPGTPIPLSPGWPYWIGVVFQGGAPTFRARGSSHPIVGDPTSGSPVVGANSAYATNNVTGAMPATAAAPTVAVNGPTVGLRFT